MSAQFPAENETVPAPSPDVLAGIKACRQQLTDNIQQILRRHVFDNRGDLASVHAFPAISQQFTEMLYQRAAGRLAEQDWVDWIGNLVGQGLSPKTAVAITDELYYRLEAMGRQEADFARRYRQDFLNTYMEARQQIIVVDHEGIHKSLMATLEKRIEKEQTLRAALEREQSLALRRAEALAAVAQINLEIAAAADEETLLQTAVTLTNRHFQLYHTHIYLLDEAGQQLVLTASAGEAARQLLDQNHAIPLSSEESLAVRAAQMRQALVVHDTRAGTGFLPNPLMTATRSAVAAPLLSRGQLFGVLNVQSDQPNRFTEDDVNIQAALAVQVATALYNARSLEQTKLLTASLEKQLEEINALQRAMTHQGWQAFITAKDRPVQGYKFAGNKARPLSRQELAAAEWPPLSAITQTGNGGAAVLPITARGAAIGALAVRHPSGEALDSEQRRLLADISSSVADALERARLFEEAELSRERAERALAETQRRTEELSIINKIVTELGASLDMQTSMQIVADGLAEALGVEQVRVTLVDESKENLTIMAEHYNPDKTESALGMKIPLAGNELTQEVMRRRKAVKITDMEHDSRVGPVRDMLLTQGVEQIFVLPMLSGNKVIGTVGVDILEKDQTLSADQMQLAETIVSQAATAVQSSRLFTQIEKRAAELAAINAISEAASSHLDLTTLAETIVPVLEQTFHTKTMYIAYYDEQSQLITFPYYYSYEGGRSYLPPRTPDEQGGFTGQIVKSGQPILFIPSATDFEEAVREARQQGGYLDSSGVSRPTSYLGAPMVVGNKVVGVIALNTHDDAKPFDQADQQLLMTLAGTVGVAVQNARLFAETEKRAAELAIINSISEAASAQLELDVLIETVGLRLYETFKTQDLYISLYDEKTGVITFPFLYVRDQGLQELADTALDREDSGFTGKIIRNKKPILATIKAREDIQEQGGYIYAEGAEPPAFVYLGVPMLVGDEIMGVIGMNESLAIRRLNESDQELLLTLAGTVGVAIQNARLFVETEERAEELAVINQVAEVVAQQLDMEQLFTAVHEQIQRAVVNDTFYFAIYNKEKDQFDFPYFFDEERKYNIAPMPFNPDLEIGRVFTSGKPIIINRTPEQQKAKEKEIKKKLLGKGKPPTNIIFVPLRIGSEIIGVLSAQNYQFREYTLSDQTLLGGIANHVAVALENIRLFTETQKRAERERLVNEINQKIQSTTSVESALQVAVQELGKAFGAKHTAVQLSFASKKGRKNGSNSSSEKRGVTSEN